jgi:hypothetical protein
MLCNVLLSVISYSLSCLPAKTTRHFSDPVNTRSRGAKRTRGEEQGTDLAGLGLPHDLDGGLLGVLALPSSRLGPVHSGQHDGVALRPPRGAVGAVERVPGAGERPELVRIPPIRAATSLHHPLPLRSGCPRRRRREIGARTLLLDRLEWNSKGNLASLDDVQSTE